MDENNSSGYSFPYNQEIFNPGGLAIKLTQMIKLFKQEGFFTSLTPKRLRQYVEEGSGCKPSEVEEWDALDVVFDLLSQYYAVRFEEGLRDGYIEHDVRFGKDTDDVVLELSSMIGEPPLYVQTSMGPGVLYVTRDDGAKEEIECVSGGFNEVVEYFNSALEQRKSDKMFYEIDTGRDPTYLCLTKQKYKALSKIWTAPVKKPAPDPVKVLQKLMENQPTDPWEYLYRAEELGKLQQRELALSDYEKVVFNEVPIDESVWWSTKLCLCKSFRRKARLEFAMARYAQCVASCSEVIGVADDRETMFMVGRELFLLRGRAYIELDEFDKALNDFSKLIADNEWDADAHFFRAQAYDRSGKEALAEKDRKKAMELGCTHLIGR